MSTLKADNQVVLDSIDGMTNDVTTAYSEGKINESQYGILKQKISQYHQSNISEKITSLRDISKQETKDYIRNLDDIVKQR